VILEKAIATPMGQYQEVQLNLNDQSSGVYFVSVSSEGVQTEVKKVVKM